MTPDPAEHLIEAARQMRRAHSVAEVVQVLMRCVSRPPVDAAEWRRRDMLNAAVRCRLHRLELALVQRCATSPELGSDMRIDIGRQLERLLAPSGCEALTPLCEMAVAAVAELAKSEDALANAALSGRSADAGPPVAWSTIGGRLFIPASAREIAAGYGLDDAALVAAIEQVSAPLRKACEPADVCHIGQLRHSRQIAPGLRVVASLDLSAGVETTPLIRIDLSAGAVAVMPTPAAAVAAAYTSGFSARLLRQLIS